MNKSIVAGFTVLTLGLMLAGCGDSKADNTKDDAAKTEKVTKPKKDKLIVNVLSSGDEATGNDASKLNYALKIKSNKKIHVNINSAKNKKVNDGQLISKDLDKGTFNMNLPVSIDDDTESISVNIDTKDNKGNTKNFVVQIKNGSDSFKQKQESIAAASSSAEESSRKAESESESASLSSSIAESESESAAESSKKAYEKSPQSYQTGITYDQLARTPDDYEGKKIQFSGEVVQVLEDDDETQIRLAVNGDYDSIIFIEVPEKVLKGSHILEDDQVTVSGLSAGTISYKSTMSGKITIPGMVATILTNSSAANSTN